MLHSSRPRLRGCGRTRPPLAQSPLHTPHSDMSFHLLLLLLSVAFRSLHTSTSHPFCTSSLLTPTASTQFAHLNYFPVPYFLLQSLFRCPASPTSRPLIAILLFLSGNIHLNPGPINRHVSLHTLNIHSMFHPNRSTYIDDIIHTNNTDIFALSETWHNPISTTPAQLISATPPGFQLFSTPRSSVLSHNLARNTPPSGGGVAFLCRDLLSPTSFQLPDYHSFEAISIRLANITPQLTIFNIYRPPNTSSYSSPFSTFLDELSSLLTLACTCTNFVITGDFNIHCNNLSDSQATQFLSLLDDFNLIQHVNFPTHIDGNTLDLLITSTSYPPTSVSCLPGTPSDHYAILSTFNTPLPPAPKPATRSFRRINSINIPDFISDLSTSDLISAPPHDLANLVHCYNSTLTNLLDKHAPLITKTVQSPKSNPWFSPGLKALKRIRRNLERRWKSLPSAANLSALRTASNAYRNSILSAKKLYHSQLITANSSNPRQLWKTINTLLHRSALPSLPNLTSVSSIAQQFTTFFADKVTNLRNNIPSVNQSPHFPQPPVTPPPFLQFRPTDPDEITKLVLQSPNKQCELDPIPTSILKQSIDILAPVISSIINLSLSTGTVPLSFQQSVVSPLLKKPNLDKDNLSNYRPISNLSLLSKLTERIVKSRLTEHLNNNSLFNTFQSAYTTFRSTETVLLSLHDSIIRAMCNKQVTCLCLLDLSAAFDTIDHSILLDRLSSWFGIHGTALSWFQSYLSNRSFITSCLNFKSLNCPLTCGVPQGSVLGPLLFSLYTTPLSSILTSTSISHHLYADDTQLFISFLPSSYSSSINLLQSAISNVSSWMSANLLSLNPSKTEFLIFGNSTQLSKLNHPTLSINANTVIQPISTARNLGILFDNHLSFDKQISAVCKSSNWHIHDLWRIRSTLDLTTAKTIATSLVHSKLDYCNSLYLNLPAYQLARLQHIQNSLARVVCKVPKYHHITPHLRSLHWLKIPQRIHYKLLSITFTLLQQQQPSYLLSEINTQPARCTRSSSILTLRRPSASRAKLSDRSFHYFIPKLWETLPPHLRRLNTPNTSQSPQPLLAMSRNQFLSGLKTHLFKQSYPP